MGCARASLCVNVLIKLLAASMCLKHSPVVCVSVRCGQRKRRCVLVHAAAMQQKKGTLKRPQILHLLKGRLSVASLIASPLLLWECAEFLLLF